jgi:hypothetical protein
MQSPRTNANPNLGSNQTSALVQIKKHSNLRFKGVNIYFDPVIGEQDSQLKWTKLRPNQQVVSSQQAYNRIVATNQVVVHNGRLLHHNHYPQVQQDEESKQANEDGDDAHEAS